MIPLYVMLSAMAVARLAGALGVPELNGWPASVRVGLGLMFLVTGTAHFNRFRSDLIRMVPPWLPAPGLLVTLTGLAEWIGGLGLLIPWTARLAAYGLMALLVVMFPADIHAASTAHAVGGRPPTPLPLRAPLQMLWVVLLWYCIP